LDPKQIDVSSTSSGVHTDLTSRAMEMTVVSVSKFTIPIRQEHQGRAINSVAHATTSVPMAPTAPRHCDSALARAFKTANFHTNLSLFHTKHNMSSSQLSTQPSMQPNISHLDSPLHNLQTGLLLNLSGSQEPFFIQQF
jgi:hypothetical protein